MSSGSGRNPDRGNQIKTMEVLNNGLVQYFFLCLFVILIALYTFLIIFGFLSRNSSAEADLNKNKNKE